MTDWRFSKYFPPTEDDLPGSSSSTEDTAPEPAQGQTTSESLAASLPNAPTREPKSPEEPIAKKQKFAVSSREIETSKPDDEDEFEGFAYENSQGGKAPTEQSNNIEEGWEDVGNVEDSAELEPKSIPLDDEPVQVEGTKDKMAKVLEADGEVASQASGVPDMLIKDW